MADISKIDPNGLYLVIDKQTGEVVYRTTWKNRRRANSYADKRNLEYGAHRFNPRTAFESEIEPQTAPRKTAMATPLQKQLSPELLMTMRQDPAMEEAFSMYNERAAEVRRIQQELAERPSRSVRNMLLGQLEDAKGNLFNMQMILEKKASEIQARRALAAKQLDERVFSAMEEPRIEDEVFGREMETQRQERQVMRGEAARRGSARTGLSAMLESEGIPRESFIDFVETPENRRSGKSVPQLIQDYKIAGELPESAGVPRGRSSAAYPLEGLSSDPILQSGTYTDEFGETVRRPTSLTVSPTSDQRALSALDPESGLNIFTPTEVEAQWEGRPLSDDDLLMRGIDPQSPTGPQDEFNLMYGGDEGFDVEKGFKFEDESPPRSIKEITEDPRYFERFNEDPRYSLNRSGVISQRLAVIDEQISGLSTNPDNIAILDNALPEDPEAGKLMRKLDELSKERDYLRSWKQQTDQSSLSRAMAPESSDVLEGMDDITDPKTRRRLAGEFDDSDRFSRPPPEDPRQTGMVAREDPVAKATAKIQQREMATRMSDPFDPEKLPKVIRPADQQRARDMGERLSKALKVMEAEFLDSPSVSGKLIKLRRAAAKLAPVLVAIGDLALAAELGYNIGKEGSIAGGVMETGADFVEGMGMIAQAPAGLAGFVPGHEGRQERGLLTPPEVAAEGLAALGRGMEGSMGAYRREESREGRRAHYERQKAFYRELEPNLSEEEIRGLAMKDVSGASTQEAMDDLQRRAGDRDVMMSAFPAQSGMIYEGMRPEELGPRPGHINQPFSFPRQPLSPEEADRAYQGSAQQREDEARYRRGGQ